MRCPFSGTISRIRLQEGQKYSSWVLCPSTIPPSEVMFPVSINELQDCLTDSGEFILGGYRKIGEINIMKLD